MIVNFLGDQGTLNETLSESWALLGDYHFSIMVAIATDYHTDNACNNQKWGDDQY